MWQHERSRKATIREKTEGKIPLSNTKKTARRAARVAAVVGTALGLTLSLSASASAHSVYESDTQWHNSAGDHCLLNKSQVDDDSNVGGKFQGWAESGYNEIIPFVDCEFPRERPANHLAAGMQIWKWSVDQWVLCTRTDKTYYNTSPTFSLNVYANSPSSGMCGPGTYGVFYHAAMHSDGGWTPTFNNPLWSGYHTGLGRAGVTAGIDKMEKPAWVTDSGTVDPEKLPDSVQVVDADGNLVLDDAGQPVAVSPLLPAPEDSASADAERGSEKRNLVTRDGSVTEEVEATMVHVAETL
ncbi:hypothetical protein [Streptomyces albidoflavus]|uniref:hypothetical protein n=1 Tax=Streptomyces albidoflavus TaxID=1886 RepID=UPI00188BEF7D|nr:hypothetical protein [Streptomyces albidoflavus]MBF4135768.1 hypothetical protein [Streptomyces albidoflavus]